VRSNRSRAGKPVGPSSPSLLRMKTLAWNYVAIADWSNQAGLRADGTIMRYAARAGAVA